MRTSMNPDAAAETLPLSCLLQTSVCERMMAFFSRKDWQTVSGRWNGGTVGVSTMCLCATNTLSSSNTLQWKSGFFLKGCSRKKHLSTCNLLLFIGSKILWTTFWTVLLSKTKKSPNSQSCYPQICTQISNGELLLWANARSGALPAHCKPQLPRKRIWAWSMLFK